jgi:RNA polymerase sigma factor (sigma-70 family)
MFAFGFGRLLETIMVPDRELLRDYADTGSQAAFTTLVQRHLNVVYRTALRRVGGNAHAADDVTQRVFTALARKAATLKAHESLAGWLYTSTRFAAAEAVRSEQRRRKHEQEAHTMNEINAESALPAEQLEPFIDEIMERLPERDREAVILHYFENRSFVEIAGMLASTADATRMRVNRAMERMRGELTSRGVVSTGAALAAVMANQSAVAAAAPTAATVASCAIGQASGWAIGASSVARAVTTLKSSPLLIGSASIVMFAGLGLGLHAGWRGLASPATLHVDQPSPVLSSVSAKSAEALREERVLVSIAEDEPVAPPPLSTRSFVAVPTAMAASPSLSEVPFAQLAPEERNILCFLWRGLDRAQPGIRPSLRVGSGAPNASGVEPLLARHWVAEGKKMPASRVIYLTAEGVAYCTAHRADIESYTPSGNLRPDSAPARNSGSD